MNLRPGTLLIAASLFSLAPLLAAQISGPSLLGWRSQQQIHCYLLRGLNPTRLTLNSDQGRFITTPSVLYWDSFHARIELLRTPKAESWRPALERLREDQQRWVLHADPWHLVMVVTVVMALLLWLRFYQATKRSAVSHIREYPHD
ncbi:MAG: hypothetical protein Tsb002_17740 [Wenzhouxiangellaceae bacterium]